MKDLFLKKKNIRENKNSKDNRQIKCKKVRKVNVKYNNKKNEYKNFQNIQIKKRK